MAAEAPADPRLIKLSMALLVEDEIRRQRRPVDLWHHLVNGTVRVHGQDMALLVVLRQGRPRLTAATAVSQVDATGPMAQWWAARVGRELRMPEGLSVRALDRDQIGLPAEDWSEGLPGHWLWLPLLSPSGRPQGILLLGRRTTPWAESDRLLAEPLAGCYGHALSALRRSLPELPRLSRRQWAGVAAAVLALLFLPVRLDTLAPGEVASADSTPVTAPFDGIVADIAVRPYQAVKAGDVLLSFDSRELAMQRDVAARTLDVAEAELASLRNQAFLDPDSKNKVAVAEQKAALERENLAYAEERLARSQVTTTEDGVVLFDDRFSWKGRPVTTGQALMTLAKPEHKELRIDLPVNGLIPTHEGAEVRLFLDMDPSHSVEGRLTRLGYEARPLPGGGLAYRFVANLPDDGKMLQLGARGTAKVYGEQVGLGYYLLRRPWAAVRQFLGV